MITVSALWSLSFILLGLMGAEIGREGLTGKNITTMALITQDLNNTRGSPVDIAKVRLTPQGIESIRNLLRGVSVQIHIESKLDGGCFLGIRNKLTISIVHISEQFGSQRNAVIQTHTKRGLHGSASGVGLFLGHGRLEGQSKLRIIIQREDGLTFKENTNRWITLGKVSDDANEIHHITSKTRNTLRDNHVDFAAFCIGNHFKELLTLIEGSTGNTLISVDLNECPMRMLYNEILVILLLQLKGSSLSDIVRGNTNIDSNPLRNIVVVVIGLFDLGYVVIVIRIDLNICVFMQIKLFWVLCLTDITFDNKTIFHNVPLSNAYDELLLYKRGYWP